MTRIVDVQKQIDEMLRQDALEQKNPDRWVPHSNPEISTLPNLVGIKIDQWDLKAEITGTYEQPVLKVLWVGPHEPRNLGRYLFAGVEYPLHTQEFEGTHYPLIYHVDEEWLKRGSTSGCPLFIYKNTDGSYSASMEVDS